METFHLWRSAGITFLIFLFVSENASLHTRKGYTRPEDDTGPVMNVRSPFLVINMNSTLSLTCEGHHEIKWNYTDELNINRNRVKIHERPIMKGFKSTLSMEDVQYYDTGYYTCMYNLNESSTPLSASVYVYVTDPNHLLFRGGSYEDNLIITAIQEGGEAVIPCKPTNPAANITLIKFPDQQVFTKEGDVEFDPTIGFTLKYPNVFFTGLFECKAELGKITQMLNLHLLMLSSKEQPSRPRISPNSININLEKRTINLTCTVTINPSDKVELMWLYPNPQNQHVQISPTEQIQIESENGYNFSSLRSTLYASHLGMADGGRYACVYTNKANKSSAAEKYIPIESPARIIGSNMAGSSLNVELGEEIKLLCQPDGYPKPELRWYKDDVIVDPYRTARFKIDYLQSKFIIEEVILTDSGLYKCMVSNRGGSQSRNITLIVIDPNRYEPSKQSTNFVKQLHIGNEANTYSKNVWCIILFVIFLEILKVRPC